MGFVVHGPPRWAARGVCAAALSAVVLAATPQRRAPPPHGVVRVERFFAPALGVEKHYLVYLPPSYATAPRRRYPVAYYLHGLWGDESDWVSLAGIDVVADSEIAGGGPEIILVMPDGDDGWYTNWATARDYAACAGDTLMTRAPPTYCVAQPRYEDYIARDLVQHVDTTYRTLPDRRHRGIAGLSMGGYGAVVLALEHPDRFSAAASHSGVLTPLYAGPHPYSAPARLHGSMDSLAASWGGMWTMVAPAFGATLASWQARDPAALARRLKAAGGPVPALYLDVGSEDALVDQSRAFHAELTALGIPHRYAEWPGKHDWRYWHAHVGESLRWLAERIGP
jgi:S-formylglutathione hydrolase FrmB